MHRKGQQNTLLNNRFLRGHTKVCLFLLQCQLEELLIEKHVLNYFEEKLQEKLNHQNKRLSLHKELGFEDSLRDSTNELSTYDIHPADMGSETYELTKQFALSRHQARQVEEVRAALERIRNGSYGYCEFCGKSIAHERLNVLPETRLCLECEEERKIEAEDMEYDRPVEEDLLEPPFYRTFDINDSVTYDGEDALQDTQKYGSSSGPQDISVNYKIDYGHTWHNSHEDSGYVEDVESISNETYRQQLTDNKVRSNNDHGKQDREADIHHLDNDEGED